MSKTPVFILRHTRFCTQQHVYHGNSVEGCFHGDKVKDDGKCQWVHRRDVLEGGGVVCMQSRFRAGRRTAAENRTIN